MKTILILIIFLTIDNLTVAQDKFFVKYIDYFGCSIELKSDSTFKFTWRFDTSGSWTIGSWINKNDTICFTAKPVYDTLMEFDQNTNKQIEKLVLSSDEKSNKIPSGKLLINSICSGGQNRYPMPSKLFFRKERLYNIDNYGRLKKKKIKGFWSNKKYDPWYFRQE